ncbi:uncharacterized protein CXorf65 homolog [Salminus brasiliensis]|uniref:uncharacterized protein CXorf65 homolog n=1 Tax=Salminus brasiliensis TaxID=930266 RepID=UPI003B837FAC
MFISIRHGENEQFLVNTNCTITVLLEYVRAELGIAESDQVDLCDEQGVLKLLFLSKNPQEYASHLLPSRETFVVCTINRSSEGAYVSITPHVMSPDPALQEELQNQTDSLEKTRPKQRRVVEERETSTEAAAQSDSSQPVKGRGRTVHADAADPESYRRTGTKRNRN